MKHHLARLIKKLPPLRWGLSLGARLFGPQNHVGTIGAVFNKYGQVLLVEHVFRIDYVWGLPGGWVERGEDPATAIVREVKEELNVEIEVKKLLFCLPQGIEKGSVTPAGLCVAFYCRLVDDLNAVPRFAAQAEKSYEVLSIRWFDPHKVTVRIPSLQQKAMLLAKQEFDREQLVV